MRNQNSTHRHRNRAPRIRYRKPDDRRENLERLKRWPSLMAHWRGRMVFIYSNEHDAYWQPEGCGYTSDGLEAGVFTFEDAWRRTNHCGPEKRIEYRKAFSVVNGNEPPCGSGFSKTSLTT
jgi:hypothetical protein